MLNSAYTIVQLIIGVMGCLLTITCFVPQGIKTIRTRNTSGLSITFPILASIASGFWIIGAILTILFPFTQNPNGQASINGVIVGSTILITNTFTFSINSIIATIKLNNVRASKRLGISEADYCYKYSKTTK